MNKRINPAAAIARCINFEELYKAPKEAFHLSASEVNGLAEALVDRLAFFDQQVSSSDHTSPRDGGINELTQSLMGGLNIQDRISSRASSTSHGSQFAFEIVKNMVQRGDFTHHKQALSEGGSSLADDMVDIEMAKAQRYAEDSAESAMD